MNKIEVDIVTPERKVYTGEAEMVIARGVEGEIGVMAGHVPLVTPLQIAPLRVKLDDGDKVIAVSGGFLEARPEKVTILAETAELAEEIDVERAKTAKAKAEQDLEQTENRRDPKYRMYKNDLKRAEMRLNVAEKQKQ